MSVIIYTLEFAVILNFAFVQLSLSPSHASFRGSLALALLVYVSVQYTLGFAPILKSCPCSVVIEVTPPPSLNGYTCLWLLRFSWLYLWTCCILKFVKDGTCEVTLETRSEVARYHELQRDVLKCACMDCCDYTRPVKSPCLFSFVPVRPGSVPTLS